ncbi:apolipoprotein N-acyltransferase [Sulfurimicrobium lacus]|uniref:Apolipoprotein N-acyltransferase n=1 Tax=Sulfurimicrobium lacus TaxID=2715678 RepID=A0A6F8V721_9PROT|nr:apolipoprotein N-acyltransferase [Sulfurimicrobium lacus]BCB25633.1 apolipoprotein N-acyltransferase [Sulfurimicrobium lacus]
MLKLLIAPSLGVLAVFGFAPFYFFPLPLLALAGLFHLWANSASPRRAALDGFTFGLGFFGAGVSWVYVSLHDFGGMPLALALTATALFCAVLAIFPAVAGFLQGRWRVSRTMRLLLLMPALWGLSEWLRGWVLTGFPWLAMGYSQVPISPLAGFAPVLGVYGVSLALAVGAGALALLAQQRQRRHALVILALLAGSGLALKQVQWVQPVGMPVAVSLVQGNIAQELKWRPEKARHTLESYARLSAASQGKLVVLPETALPMFLGDVPPAYLEQLAQLAQSRGGDVVVGIPEEIEAGKYFNSAFSYGSAPTQVYRKYHLVPFGEFLPLRSALDWVLTILHIPLADFARGAQVQQPMAVANQHLAVDICYEDVFGEEIIRQLPRATILANLTNDAWFGHSLGPWQHLQIAQMRALETGRFMLRATNTGVTAIIDQRGQVTQLAPVFTATVLEGSAQGFAGATPYVRFGNLPLLLLLALLLAMARKFRQ